MEDENCSNHWLCKSTFYTICKTRAAEKELCQDCDVLFGKKIVIDDTITTCPVCLEDTNGNVIIPWCDIHIMCKKCFQNMSYGVGNEPEFPYDEDIEEEYIDDPDNIKFINDPLIIEWDRQYSLYLDNRDSTKTHTCPICRCGRWD